MGRSAWRLAAAIKPAQCPGGDSSVASTVSGKDKERMKLLTFSRVKHFRFRARACHLRQAVRIIRGLLLNFTRPNEMPVDVGRKLARELVSGDVSN